jgi:hypothetical protein
MAVITVLVFAVCRCVFIPTRYVQLFVCVCVCVCVCVRVCVCLTYDVHVFHSLYR